MLFMIEHLPALRAVTCVAGPMNSVLNPAAGWQIPGAVFHVHRIYVPSFTSAGRPDTSRFYLWVEGWRCS